METINDVKIKYMNMRDKFQDLEIENEKLKEGLVHKDFKDLYESGTKEELVKYHSIGVQYNVSLHKEAETLRQNLKELEAKNKQQEKFLIEACKIMDLNCKSFSSVNMDTSYRLNESFLNKLLIKELLERNKRN